MTIHLHSSRSHRRSQAPALIWALASATALVLGLASFWPAAPKPSPAKAEVGQAPVMAAVLPSPALHERQPAPAPTPETVAAWTFDQYMDRLIELGLLTSTHAREGRKDLATTSDVEVRRLFAEMLEKIADAPEQALQARAASVESEEPRAVLREQILVLAVEAGLQFRQARAKAGDPRGALDQLTAAVLGVLPVGALADRLGRLLVDQPFLAACHEQAVLDLMTLSGEGRFSQEVAVGLLLTLWRNLEQSGVRTSDEMAALALLWLDDAKAGNRLAACMQLLTAAGGRFRDVVLERVRNSRDLVLARELAAGAAKDLPVATALPLVEELARSGCQVTGAVMFAAYRQADVVIKTYEQRLADGVNGPFRGELVASLGIVDTPEALATVRMAFRSDPDLPVRIRAMYVLTGRPAAALGEQALQEMLDDPRSGSDPQALTHVVTALQNLEQAGLVNAVDRLGQRLRTCKLDSLDRGRLERLLARALPGGPR